MGRLILLAAILSGLNMNPERVAADSNERVFRAGAYAADITPPYFPVSSTPHRDHQIFKAHDRLHARCLVLDDGHKRIAIVICDNNMIPREFFDAAKEKASAATGIPTENMLMAATHTHSAVTVAGIFQSKRETKYIPFLVARIAKGIETPEHHRLGGYEAWRARSSYLEVDAATKVQAALLALLKEVAADRQP